MENGMEKRHIAALDMDISLLGFGTMRLPLVAGGSAVDQKLTEAMIARALEAGVNYFDTAFTYHKGISELLVGRILHKYPREKYLLADKLPLWTLKSREEAEHIFTSQLKKCRVDYFDFYLLHGLNAALYAKVEAFGLHDWLYEKKRQGLVRHIGFSFHDTPALFRRILDAHDWEFAQIQLNYVDWDSGGARELYGALVEKNLPAVIMEPVRGGSLARLPLEAETLLTEAAPQASVASWAIRYAASLPQVMVVLSGMSALEHVEDNIATMQDFRPLSEDEHALLQEVAARYRASGDIPCTGCGYCMPCPEGVNIPALFAAYNYRNKGSFEQIYCTIEEAARPGACIACGKCMRRCPQQLDIPSLLRQVAEYASA